MNKIYRLIWDSSNNAFVAVSENTKAKGKRTSKTLLAMTLLATLGLSLSSNSMADAVTDAVNAANGAATSANTAATSANTAAGAANTALESMNAAVEKVESNIDAIFRGSNTYSDLSNRINQNSSDIRNNRKLAAQGIAGLAAMTNIPSPAIAGTTSIGTGVGYFDNESSIAIGVSHYFENNISIKGSVSSGFNSGNSTVVGAGVSYTWN